MNKPLENNESTVAKNGNVESSVANEKSAAISADISLPNDLLERLYQRYSIKQRRAGLGCFLATSVLFDLWAIFAPQQEKSFHSIGTTCIFLVLNISLAVFLRVCGNHQYRGAIWEIAPLLAWLFEIVQLFLQLFFKGVVTPRDSIGWWIVLNFLVYVTLPVRLRYTGILLGIGSFASHILTIIGLSKRDSYHLQQQIANSILLATAATVGLLCYFLGEAKQRRAFLEAKKSLEVKMVIEEQSAEQERLLLSVLPEHVAVKMRQDLGSNDSEQFKKIYMMRHENVSILYADIVGFTAISSTYSAQDLVKMLNELFARFDRLAEKYHQLRIKILGDCYYCISGAIERPDHAVLCVYMGLSMVKAIKYVQQKTNSPVDMRVGIHTGAVLAGILGQRQWQYDVYSKDVELANKMESSGMAGRVHISEKTLQCLSGEFEVEPAFGEKREETLRIAGLRTYFIKKVLKHFVSENETKTDDVNTASIEADGPSETFKDEETKCHTPDDDIDNVDKVEIFKNRLRKELVSRDGHGELTKDTTHLLQFKNPELETAYVQQRERLSSLPLVASLLVQIVAVIYASSIHPLSLVHFTVILSPIILLLPIIWISVAESFPKLFPENVIQMSRSFNDINILRRLAAILTVGIVGISNLFDMYMCASSFTTTTKYNNATMAKTIALTIPYDSTNVNRTLNGEHFASVVCTLFPSYYSNYAILILIATSMVAQLTHICKFCLMLVLAGLHCYMNIFQLQNHFKIEEGVHASDAHPTLHISLSVLLILVSIALGFLSRHMDKEDRVIFKWKNEVAEQKEKASDMRHRNEKLVYNILPVHVAEYFIRNKSRSYDELYSQSYDEVGVLFASMPNFSDFYSEDTVNNQGLECLRFLNEVISDFDALLGVPQFQDVIKIKTIGSTYMAASGLNNKRIAKPDDSVLVRWEPLAKLVEFALELKKALQSINEQSFNHFVLKMGINHGPITAGVIGARKPHYDIWGNTVNVASRMESTGKAGAIQVTHETCEILRTFGYTFEQRGLVAVKGKGQLMTYYLSGKSKDNNPTTSIMSNEFKSTNSPSSMKPLSPALAQSNHTSLVNKLSMSPLSSCSNSPNSVKINQNYDPNKLENQSIPSSSTQQPLPPSSSLPPATTHNLNHNNSRVYVNENNGIADDSNKIAADLDNLEDADSKPLLANSNCGPSINKRANGKYGIGDLDTDDIGNHENETLINSSNSNV